ncbi:MAG: 2-amino-4-hydroxy-6-hydroxymethyldihydropteridine diphosphokinase [Plesiomonas sp.]|uniref:2-amino-4-hydroxy-6- hydroxymethyldihydropteridine diphosphokinase n=1 Tax=Plesiomonas sp. TaxID=2486279 RepID=UPI003F2FB0D7
MVTLFIGIGSNTEREKHVRAAVQELQQAFTQVELSPVYEAKAVGVHSDNYYNLVAKCQTELDVIAVSQLLQAIENRWERRARHDVCTLDLDLLLYGNMCRQDKPILPRRDILHCAFVLQPLADLAPQLLHPEHQLPFAILWQQFARSEQLLWPIPFVW